MYKYKKMNFVNKRKRNNEEEDDDEPNQLPIT